MSRKNYTAEEADNANLTALTGASDGGMFPIVTERGPMGSSTVAYPSILLLRSLGRIMVRILARLDALEKRPPAEGA